jgi:hypothetical protein
LPTAVQALLVGHDTPDSSLKVAPVTSGVEEIVQLVPSQLSASVVSTAPVKLPPTAVQALVEGHDTPHKVDVVAPVGFGVDWIDQLVPSQLSASVS